MKPRLIVPLFVAGLLVLGILAIACGDDGGENDEDAITEVLEEMVAAVNDRDFEALAPLITANAFLDTEPIPEALQEALENAEKIRGPYGQVTGFKIISVMVFGDKAVATVSLTIAGETTQEGIPLVKQDGRWLIDGIPRL